MYDNEMILYARQSGRDPPRRSHHVMSIYLDVVSIRFFRASDTYFLSYIFVYNLRKILRNKT